MIIKQALQWGIEQLKKANIDSAELDAELLLVYSLNSAIRANRRIDRVWLYAHSESQLTNFQLKTYKLFIKQRVQREPVAYILGHKEFYGLDFEVNKNVLIPRPETEVIVDKAIEELKRSALHDPCLAGRQARSTIIDIGTGSGAIVVAVAKEQGAMSKEQVVDFFALDNSLVALKVAKQNARRNGVGDRIRFFQGDLLEPLIKCSARIYPRPSDPKGSHYIIVANLPYIPTAELKTLQPEITKYEPRMALDGGRDGLKYYREMFKQLSVFIRKHPCLSVLCFCEIDPRQTKNFKKLARKYFSKEKIKIIKDLAGKNRVVKITFTRL